MRKWFIAWLKKIIKLIQLLFYCINIFRSINSYLLYLIPLYKMLFKSCDVCVTFLILEWSVVWFLYFIILFGSEIIMKNVGNLFHKPFQKRNYYFQKYNLICWNSIVFFHPMTPIPLNSLHNQIAKFGAYDQKSV